jgi:MFS family permease
LAMIFVDSFFYGVAMQGLPYLYFTEIVPYYLRAKGLNIAYISMNVAIVFNGYVNPIAMDAIGWRYYIVWICLIATWLILAYILYPETKGRSLETVGEVFGEPVVEVNEKGLEQEYVNVEQR